MDEQQLLRLQKKISIYHRFILVIVFAITLVLYPQLGGKMVSICCVLYAMLCVTDYIVYRVESFRSTFTVVTRYIVILIFIAGCVGTQDVNTFMFGFCLLGLSWLNLEFVSLFNFQKETMHIPCFVAIAIPMFIGPVVGVFVYQYPLKHMYVLELLFVVIFLIDIIVTKLIEMVLKENDERVFAQERLLEKVNNVNKELVIKEERVKKANDLLGQEKINLKYANTRLNEYYTEMQIQNNIIKHISSSLGVGQLMSMITQSFINEMGVNVCAIVLYPCATEQNSMKYCIHTSDGFSDKKLLDQKIEEDCFAPFLSDRSLYYDNDVSKEKYTFIGEEEIKSLLLLPLLKENSLSGVLYIAHKDKNYFTDNISFFESIVSQILIALDNANMYARMENMAIRDGLTGIYNRGFLTKLVNDCLNNAILSGKEVSIVLFDIDHFKNVNDTYGHLAGDLIIQTLARLGAKIADENGGYIGRYGGEEFVIVFPDKDAGEVQTIMEKMQSTIRNTNITYHEYEINVRISIGITTFPTICKHLKNLLNHVDWALYYSKQHGRDRITIDSDEIQESFH